MNKFDVLIVGAGYAGLMCALRLAARVKGRPVKIGVVNPSAGFVERLRLHEGLADGASLLRPLDLHHVLKKTGIALIAGRVVSLDRAAQRVGVETAGAVGDVDYGRLVIAAGSHNRRDQILGAVSVAYSLDADHPRGAAALREALSANEHSRVLVIGGGASGNFQKAAWRCDPCRSGIPWCLCDRAGAPGHSRGAGRSEGSDQGGHQSDRVDGK